MKNVIAIFAIVYCCGLSQIAYSQSFHTSSGKALKIYKEGVTAFDYLEFNKAEKDLREAITIDPKFYEAFMMMGELMAKQGRHFEASLNYKKAVKIDSLYFKPVFFNLAISEIK